MVYRVCKSFEIESGHMLHKHPGLCRFLHGHTRRVEVVLACETLDQYDMVCDFKVVRLAVGEFLNRLDHAMAVNSNDPVVGHLPAAQRERLVVFNDQDPTTEVFAKYIYEFLAGEIARGGSYREAHGGEYRFNPGVVLERVRVSETSSSWAEYGRA
ncbi:MAG: 6-carboxytetrahydropterin synthase [Phycisphaeraceae bacterium]|nr:6-carboxytetrahydropterin synthase [Phycisphaeraceae bacterium]